MSAAVPQPTVTLADGSVMPQLGYGVWRVADHQAEDAIGAALGAGYRAIDTAALYKNEAGVGRAIAAARDRGIDDVFLTSKVWNGDQGYDSTLRAFDVTMDKLAVDVLDLYLIHWPMPDLDRYLDTWRALIKLQADGRVRSIGVSNFRPVDLIRLVDETGVAPVINQVELHPYFQQRELRQFLADNDIAVEAWAPLGAGEGLLDDPVLVDVARRNGISPAQAVLAWHLAQGIVAIPKSITPSRIVENLAATGITLPAEDLALIDGLDRVDGRTGLDPATVNRY
jgi:2,5-diketo-D-gluconate reductase A